MKNNLLILLIIFLANNVTAQFTPALPVDTIKIRSVFLEDEREVWIQRPNGYDTTSKKYPVLIVPDADGHFNYVRQFIPYLHNQFNKDIPPMIIVGLRSINRAAFFTPKTGIMRYDTLPGRGRADDYHDFIEKELFRTLNGQYRLKDFRIVLGHSLGGLFSLYSISKNPGFFKGIIAVSPSVTYSGNHFFKDWLPQILKTKMNDPCFIYITVSDNDLAGYLEANNKLATELEANKNAGILWQYKVMQEYNHWTVAPPSFYEGLLQMFKLPQFKNMINE